MAHIITRINGQKVTATSFTQLAHRLITADEPPYIDWDADPYATDADVPYTDVVDALGVRLTAAEPATDFYSEGDWDSYNWEMH